jgi:hypothetical protein
LAICFLVSTVNLILRTIAFKGYLQVPIEVTEGLPIGKVSVNANKRFARRYQAGEFLQNIAVRFSFQQFQSIPLFRFFVAAAEYQRWCHYMESLGAVFEPTMGYELAYFPALRVCWCVDSYLELTGGHSRSHPSSDYMDIPTDQQRVGSLARRQTKALSLESRQQFPVVGDERSYSDSLWIPLVVSLV